jgi:hypothetical protein
VVDCVDGEASAPPDLRIAWDCQRYHCLPDAGGYLDQNYRTMLRMTILSNIYNAYAHYRNSQGAQIHTLGESDRRILRYLKDEGLLFKA